MTSSVLPNSRISWSRTFKNYSSGMQVRLATSVAISSQGDILVLDEVLAVGRRGFPEEVPGLFL